MQRIKRMHKIARLGLILFSGIMLTYGLVAAVYLQCESSSRNKIYLHEKADYLAKLSVWEAQKGDWDARRTAAASRGQWFNESAPSGPSVPWRPHNEAPEMLAVTVVGFCLFWLLIRFWLWIYDRTWAQLTCEGRLQEGPRRLLIALSAPFFLFLIAPGIVFWLLVWCVLWIRAGYKTGSGTELARQGTGSESPIKVP